LAADEPRAENGVEEMVRRLLAGDRRAVARVLSWIEDGGDEGAVASALLYGHGGRAHSVGVTGAPGSGKSTLVCAMTQDLRRRGKTVGIVAVDPSSAFTHGALLGDRIRMQELTADEGVFLRSMASRGQLGGLAPKTAEVMAALDAAGKDVVIVETLGAGQDEVDIAGAAQTTVVLNVPGSGDDVQAMKAGLLEAADILVVNKADTPNASRVAEQLHAALCLSPIQCDVPVLLTVATTGEGVRELVDAVEGHRRQLAESGALERHRVDQARRQVTAALRELLFESAIADESGRARLEEAVRAVAAREVDPWSAARRLVRDQ
jgi:LAO/AO transport system kinase